MNRTYATKRTCTLLIIASFISCLLAAQDPEARWTHFRGSQLDGKAPGSGYPVRWSEGEHISWKTAIEGKGWSSPVVYGDQVWLTTEADRRMRAICVDLNTGEILRDQMLFFPDRLYPKHSINTYATPTPVIEKDRIYIHFGRYGTACLDTGTGETVWSRSDMQIEHIQGPGSSLMIYGDLLIVHMEGSDIQYIAALNKRNGETVWRTDRPRELYDRLTPIGKKAYTTPIIVRVNGRDLLISNGSAACIAYDPLTGEEVWRVIQGEDSTISMPVEYNGIVYFYTSFVQGANRQRYAELMAVDPEGRGDITGTNIIWRLKSPILQLPTPVIADGLLYTVDSEALLSCLDAATGNTVWSRQLKGKYHSSPIIADGLLYVSSTDGNTLVFKTGRTEEIVAENNLDGEIWATPAFTEGAIILRTDTHLYRIED